MSDVEEGTAAFVAMPETKQISHPEILIPHGGKGKESHEIPK